MNYQYSYVKMDNVLPKGTQRGSYDYGYDELYRLTTADNPVSYDESFTYELVGNRLSSAEVEGDWTYDENSELLGYDEAKAMDTIQKKSLPLFKKRSM